MTKRKRRKGQTMMYKTPHRKPKTDQHERHQKGGSSSCSTCDTRRDSLVTNTKW